MRRVRDTGVPLQEERNAEQFLRLQGVDAVFAVVCLYFFFSFLRLYGVDFFLFFHLQGVDPVVF